MDTPTLEEQVLHLRGQGKTFAEIGAELGCSREWARRIVRRFEHQQQMIAAEHADGQAVVPPDECMESQHTQPATQKDSDGTERT